VSVEGGSRNSYVATLVERHSRYVMLVKVANKDSESVVSALIRQSQRLPSELYQSLTWDRGKELADHQRLTLATEIDVYFCDSRCQRGSSENTNRLLRQYLPRGTDLSLHTQAKPSAIARRLNEKPRKTLLFQTPAEKFAECVAAISWTRHRKQTIGDSPFKWAYSNGITAGLIQHGSFKVNFGAGGCIPSETGGYIQRRRDGNPRVFDAVDKWANQGIGEASAGAAP
jgi:hypothetical protein